MKPKILAGVVAVLLLVGGGAFALTRMMSASEDVAVSFAPPDSFAYMNAFIRPSNSQKSALDDLLQKFPGIDSTDEAIQKITDLLDEALAGSGFDYTEDIDPWLGDQVAAFMMPGGTVELPNFAVLVESKDDEALQDFIDRTAETDDVELEEVTYGGETYQVEKDGDEPVGAGIVDGFLIFGTEEALEAAIDTHAGTESLETAEKFTTATEPLEDDWLGLFYVDTAAIVEEFGGLEDLTGPEKAAFDSFGFSEQAPTAAILYATSDSAVFETSSSVAPGSPLAQLSGATGEAGLLPDLPADTWAAFGLPDLGASIDVLFESFQGIPGFDDSQLDAMFYAQTGLRLQEDLLSWMGDTAVFVQGENLQEIAGGLVIESTDPAKTGAVVDKLEGLARDQGLAPDAATIAGLEGFSVQIPNTPAPIFLLGGERFVIAYGEAAASGAAGEGAALEESDSFAAAQDAVGDDFAISFFVDIDAAQKLGETVAGFTGESTDTYDQEVKPYLDVLTHFVWASKKDGDVSVQKIVLGVE